MIANAISNALGGTDGSTAALLPSMSPKELGLAVLPRVVKKSSTHSAAGRKQHTQRREGGRESNTAASLWSVQLADGLPPRI